MRTSRHVGLIALSTLGLFLLGGRPATAAADCEDPFGLGVCDGSVFQSTINLLAGRPGDPTIEPTANAFITNLLGGQRSAILLGQAGFGFPPDVIVPLNVDPCDATLADCSTGATGAGEIDAPNTFFNSFPPTVNARLSQPQQGLLGCGEPFGINCETVGIGLADADLSALFQSWVDLTQLGPDFDTTNAAVPQPGTLSAPPPTCVGQAGCRGPADIGYDPLLDGTVSGLLHPFTGQSFRSELAALSWNAMMTFVILSSEFDPFDPFRSDGCSLARPQLCSAVCALLALRTQTVVIDIIPGSGPAPINTMNHGVIPVAILGSTTFDVADVDPSTLAFGPGAAPLGHRNGPHPVDLNHDGFTDLLAHFPTADTGIASGDDEACVTGELLDGTQFQGCDLVTTMPPQCPGQTLEQVIGPENGGFETGDFTGWNQINSGFSGGITIDDGTFDPAGPGGSVAPFEGSFAAATFQSGPGAHTLFTDVSLDPSLFSARVDWADNLQNWAGGFVDPSQEWRVEVWDPSDDSFLAELFSTNPGDPPFQDWTVRSADLTPWIGETIRLAFTQRDTFDFFNARLDAVSIKGTTCKGGGNK